MVHYFCHPLAGQEIEPRLHLVQGGVSYYVVTLPDGSDTYLPVWMTDEVICRNFIIEPTPVSTLEALQNAQQLLDHLKSNT